jgi:hypothetical protein
MSLVLTYYRRSLFLKILYLSSKSPLLSLLRSVVIGLAKADERRTRKIEEVVKSILKINRLKDA